ncbi:hypothetical protein [Aureimonas sp. D3]|uniref:hypothetical protein n=1 Tax=Aureimonas sp. D3 TaxID=1638164 RepID=UPI000782D210|nr:hypothetical protein [Aureimonas sp. D3]
MSTADQMLRAYRRMMARSGEQVMIRRGEGAAGRNIGVRARVTTFDAHEVVGDIVQTDTKLIVMAEDVTLDPPFQKGDRVMMHGRTLAIVGPPNDKTRRVGGVLIAYEFAVRG